MDPYLGEIRIFSGSFAPINWAFCNGSLFPIAANTALFSLLGTTYGGDGIRTFALPDLRGRAPMHFGTGAGLSPRFLGEGGGSAIVTLNTSEIPKHTHSANCQTTTASDQTSPLGAVWSNSSGGRKPPDIYSSKIDIAMNPQAIGISGQNVPHNNMQPNLGLNFIIALAGIFPPRS